jgi:hypothetical protein
MCSHHHYHHHHHQKGVVMERRIAAVSHSTQEEHISEQDTSLVNNIEGNLKRLDDEPDKKGSNGEINKGIFIYINMFVYFICIHIMYTAYVTYPPTFI